MITSVQKKGFFGFLRHYGKSYQTKEIKEQIAQELKSLIRHNISRVFFADSIRQIRVTIEHEGETGKICFLIEDFIFNFRNSCYQFFATDDEINTLQKLDQLNHQLKKNAN